MSKMSKDLRTLILKNNDGTERRIQCQREVFNMLLSNETDSSVKSLLIQNLLNQKPTCTSSPGQLEDDSSLPFTSKPSETLSKSESPLTSTRSITSSRSESPLTSTPSETSSRSKSPLTSTPSETSTRSESQGNSSSTHIWKSEEEDALVNLRHDKNDQFLKCKNHTALWKDISAHLNKVLQCNVTPNQAMNKYYSMKKRWKEIIDAPTETERRYFRQKEQFDEMYGTKESTRPTVIIDTMNKKGTRASFQENQVYRSTQKGEN